MTLSTLAGTKWTFNSTITLPTSSIEAYIPFTANGTTGYYSFTVSSTKLKYYYYSPYYFLNDDVYTTSGGWIKPSGRIIQFGDGNDASNKTIVNWVQANATQLTADDYNIVTFDANRGRFTRPVSTQIVMDGKKSVRIPDSAVGRPDYTLSNWRYNGSIYDFSTQVTSDITLTASWSYSPSTYTVTFNANGHGTAPSPVTGVESGSTIAEPSPAPSATGYTFGGWYKESECANQWDFSTDTVTTNRTLYAKWTATEYSITYDLDGGTVETPNPSSYTIEIDSFTLNNPSKTQFEFDGWTGTDLTEETMTVTIPTGSTGDRSYTANYTALVTTYTVTFHNNGHGYTPQTQTVIENQTATQPTAPTETGWTFGGWFTEQVCTNAFSFSTPITANTDLWAKWTAIPQYTVTFAMNGHGTQIPQRTVYSGSTTTRPTDPTDEDYEFINWYSNSALTTLFNFSTPITQNTVIYAKWRKIPKLNWNGNRLHETFTYTRVGFDDWMEHEDYRFITKGSIEYATDAELKVTGSFDFEGEELPNTSDLIRVKYSFTDSQGMESINILGTFAVSYAELNYKDTTKGIISCGTLNANSVLSILQDKVTGVPLTITAGSQAIYEAIQLIRECGLYAEADDSSFTLTADHTFDSGTDYLEMVNWLCATANFSESYPDVNGVVQLKSVLSNGNTYQFANGADSIIYPEIDASNEWQTAPNVVRLLYNTDENCVAAWARNLGGSKSSLSERGDREVTYFEEVSDIGSVASISDALVALAESTLREKSSDIEYVTLSHAYLPVYLGDTVELDYSGKAWEGKATNISIELAPATKTQTKLKRELSANIVIDSDSTTYREAD